MDAIARFTSIHPWQYPDTASRAAAESHYPTMTLKDLSELPVPRLAPLLSDCVDQLVASRRTAHSEKPTRFYELLEKISPGPMLELFGENAKAGTGGDSKRKPIR